MTRRTRIALAVAAATTSSLLVVGGAAHATPVFDDAATWIGGDTLGGYAITPDCSSTGTSAKAPVAAVVENGPSMTSSSRFDLTGGGPGSADSAVVTARSDGSASVRSAAGNLTSIDLTERGSTTATYKVTPSMCSYAASAGTRLAFSFTVSTPGYLHVSAGPASSTDVAVELHSALSGTTVLSSAWTGHNHGYDQSVLLTPGRYSGYVIASFLATFSASGSVSDTVDVHGEFHPLGSAVRNQAGRGGAYLSLAGARSCAGHDLVATVTPHRRLARKLRKIVFFVGDNRVETVRTPARGAAVTVPLLDGSPAGVRAQVVLRATKLHHHTKVLETTATYEACS